jgi:outer membrane protein assembly factor BamB
MLVTATHNYIIALNTDTGEKLWSIERRIGHDMHPNTPLYHDGMILSLAGYGGGAVMLRLGDGGKFVEQIWKNSEVDTRKGGAVKIGNYFYASGDMNRFWYCVEWETGEIKYRESSIAHCSVISADDMLYCYGERGTMSLVKPNSDEFELISSFEVTLGEGPHFAHPVIYNGVLYIRHADALMAYKIK